MSNFARIVDGVVVEVFPVPQGSDLADLLHPDLASHFIACGDEVEQNWAYEAGTFSAPDGPTLEMMKASKASLVDATIATILAAGAPAGALHVSLTDSSRADMGSMATTALAAIGGAVSWPDSYKEGWISIENTRIPLATPNSGLALAAGVGDFYASVRQNGRTLKDKIASAATVQELDAVDVDAGWPA